MLEISHSASSIARGCWQKYKFHYVDGLTPKQKSHSLTLGSAVHKAFELHFTGHSEHAIAAAITTMYDEELGKAKIQEIEDLQIGKYIATGMWLWYPYKDLTQFEEYEAEKEFSVRLGKLRGVRLVGKVDGRIKLAGNHWVREVKTTGLSPRQFRSRMNTSAQASGYVYGMRKMGYPVQGVLYDMLKRPLLRKHVNENADDFGKRIMKSYEHDAKQPPDLRKYYLQHYEYRSKIQMEQYEEDMSRLVRDIRTRKRTQQWYRNTDQCWNYNTLCPYARICNMDVPDQLTLNLYYEQKAV